MILSLHKNVYCGENLETAQKRQIIQKIFDDDTEFIVNCINRGIITFEMLLFDSHKKEIINQLTCGKITNEEFIKPFIIDILKEPDLRRKLITELARAEEATRLKILELVGDVDLIIKVVYEQLNVEKGENRDFDFNKMDKWYAERIYEYDSEELNKKYLFKELNTDLGINEILAQERKLENDEHKILKQYLDFAARHGGKLQFLFATINSADFACEYLDLDVGEVYREREKLQSKLERKGELMKENDREKIYEEREGLDVKMKLATEVVSCFLNGGLYPQNEQHINAVVDFLAQSYHNDKPLYNKFMGEINLSSCRDKYKKRFKERIDSYPVIESTNRDILSETIEESKHRITLPDINEQEKYIFLELEQEELKEKQ